MNLLDVASVNYLRFKCGQRDVVNNRVSKRLSIVNIIWG